MPYSVNISCRFAVWSVLYQIFLFFFFFLQRGLSDLKQQSYEFKAHQMFYFTGLCLTLLFLFFFVTVRCEDGFDLAEALGGDDEPTKRT